MQDINIQSFLNAPKLRIDTWNSLAVLAKEYTYSKNEHPNFAKIENEIKHCLDILEFIENYHAFPGKDLFKKIRSHFNKNQSERFNELISLIVYSLKSNSCNFKTLLNILQSEDINHDEYIRNIETSKIYYFEVLVVEDISKTNEELLKSEIETYFKDSDEFVYELIFVNSFQDALVAIMFNFNIKCCLISDLFQDNLDIEVPFFRNLVNQANLIGRAENLEFVTNHPASKLATTIRNLRQKDLDLYYLTSYEPEKKSANFANTFDRIFYEFESYFELHFTILQGIKNHFETPFFDSLRRYTFQPKSTFHALPIARGKSIFKSRWARDMHEFYGKNIFLAESSSTAGGLDSLMNPSGSIKKAMQKASQFFGSHETFFVTNGTSASNKIVLQALLRPGDIILVEHCCHESHHYGIISTGAYPIFLNGFKINHCDIAGPIPLRTIKEKLLQLKKADLLHKVKLIILSNCTFDGLVYNVQNYMEEILAIKPDMIFFWDEAWFAYARCIPHYRLRTAMFSASMLETRYKSKSYLEEYKAFKEKMESNKNNDEFLLNTSLKPDPEKVKLRVYCTQSTHKTLSCFRQGSMIHVYDHDFETLRISFTHAFVTYSTTSPNYQIIATMDLARRQAELEGFELVQNAIELAMIFRQEVNRHPVINKFFQALGPTELIPEEYRQSKVASGYDATKDWGTVERAWVFDEIVIDPTRVTLWVKHGLDGYSLRRILMDKFGIQVNKVSLNSILLQFNIGTLRSSVSFLLEALFEIVKEIQAGNQNSITRQSEVGPPPLFSEFSSDWLAFPNLPAGDLRRAFYDGEDDNNTQIMPIDEIIRRIKAGEKIVSASIIIPVPPGYPALLPGQLVTEQIINYLLLIDASSILGGFSLKKGFKVFKV